MTFIREDLEDIMGQRVFDWQWERVKEYLNDHPEPPLATIGMPIHKATDGLGLITSLCKDDGYNLAMHWNIVTCPKCLVFHLDGRVSHD